MSGSRYICSLIVGMLLLLPLLVMVCLQLGKVYIQSTREERLNTGELVQVVLPANKVTWEEAEKELWIGNRMFDVASYTIVNDNYHLTGVFDDEETEVAGSLLHSILSNNGDSLLQLLLLMQCFAGGLLLFSIFPLTQQTRKKRTTQHFYLPSLLYLVLGPPPRYGSLWREQ